MKQERYDIIKQLIDIEYWNIDINKGTVTPKKTKRVPVKAKSMEEYDSISLVYAGKQYRFYVHQIIAIAGGMDPVGYQITHKNGDIHDNSFSNLKLIDTLHEIKYGLPETKRVKTDLTCEKHPRAKLSNDAAIEERYKNFCEKNPYTVTRFGRRVMRTYIEEAFYHNLPYIGDLKPLEFPDFLPEPRYFVRYRGRCLL